MSNQITLKKIADYLNDFRTGNGKTNDETTGIRLADKLRIEGLSLWYNGEKMTFENESHKNAYFARLLHNELKDKPLEQVKKLFEHLEKGFISLNHTGAASLIETDKTEPFKALFDSLNVIEVKRNGKGSKLYQLIIDKPTTETIDILATNGFTNISPLIDGLTIVGLKVELPTI